MSIWTRPLVFIDVETTGARRDDRVLEIGAVRVEAGREVGRFTSLLDPFGYVPPAITALTGITDDDIAPAPQFEAVAVELAELLDGAVFTAHNVAFDYGFIEREFTRNHDAFAMPWLDTVLLSRRLYPGERYHSLDAVVARHNIPMARRHRALNDALALWQFFQILLYEFDLDTVERAMAAQLKRQKL